MHHFNLSAPVNDELKKTLERAGISEERLMLDSKKLKTLKQKKNRKTKTEAKDKSISLNMHLRFKQVREWNGQTQKEFAEALSTSKPRFIIDSTAICRIETGNRDIEPELIAAVCIRFAISPYWLLWGKGVVAINPDFARTDKTKKSSITAKDYLMEIEELNFKPEYHVSCDVKEATADTVQNRALLIADILQDKSIRKEMLKQHHYLRFLQSQ